MIDDSLIDIYDATSTCKCGNGVHIYDCNYSHAHMTFACHRDWATIYGCHTDDDMQGQGQMSLLIGWFANRFNDRELGVWMPLAPQIVHLAHKHNIKIYYDQTL